MFTKFLKAFALYQPVDASRFNIYNAWDNVVTSTDDGLYHQLIGTYRGWDKRAIYIAGYNSSIASTYATERVYIGNPNLTNKFMTVDLLSGNVGIGTTNPRANLDMAKDLSNGQLGTVFGRLPEGDATGLGTYLGVKGYATQGADPYNIKSFSLVHDFYGQTNSSINFYRGGGVLGGFITFNTSDNTEKMRIATDGNVGIGTTSPDAKLAVKGQIHAQEVKVDLQGALVPDYVFAKEYKLKSLAEVEAYVKTNSHLPEVPSAKEIEKNGLQLGEMNMVLLKKIEEMTLYMIEFKKENSIMEKTINTLNIEIQELKSKQTK